MTVKKNYEAFAATLRAFRVFAAQKGWKIITDREIDYGHQIVVFDGMARNNLNFYPSGKIILGGRKGTSLLKNSLQSLQKRMSLLAQRNSLKGGSKRKRARNGRIVDTIKRLKSKINKSY